MGESFNAKLDTTVEYNIEAYDIREIMLLAINACT